jgi:hypothetical protein
MAKQQGPSKAELDAIRNSLKEIEQLYIKLGGIDPFKGIKAENIASSTDEVTRLRNELQDARDAVSDMEGEAGDLFKSWRAITDEVKGHRRIINDSKSTVSKINDLSQKLKDHQNKINSLSSKDLNNIKSKLEQQKSILKTNQDSLQSTIDELRLKQRTGTLSASELSQLREAEMIQKNITGGLEKNNGILDSNINKAEQEAKARKEIETSLGATGGILKGLSKIPLIKDVVDTEKVLKAANDEIEISKSGIKGLGAGFKNIGGQIKTGLLNPANLALGFITQMAAALKIADDGAGKLAKDFNLTYSEALNVRRELGTIAATSMDAALNTKNLQETLTFVGSQLGSNAKLNEADLKTFTKLREQAGYTNEELYGIQQMSLLNGKSLAQNTKEILGGAQAYASRNKLVINEKQVLRDVSKASASLKLTLGGSAEAVAEAAVRARQFGLNLEQAEKISQSLLQFESSIESELSAELLTGRDLNFERARGLALNGETAKAAEEIAKQVGTSADFAKMNVIQQEAIAKAAGMTKDELAQSLMDREALTKLSAKEGENAQQAFNRLVQEVGMEEAKKRLGDEQLATQYEQQSVQERFAQAVEKLQEVFVQLAEPILAIVSPLANLASTILPGISFLMQGILIPIQLLADGFNELFTLSGGFTDHLLGALKLLGGIAGAYLLIKTYQIAANREAIINGSLQKGVLATLIAQAAAWAVANPFTALAGLAIAGAVTAGLYSMVKGDDVLSPGGSGSGYGKRTLFGPEGAIQLNDKDTVIAATDPFKKADDMVSSPKGSVTVSNKTSPKKETPIDINAGTNARLDALIAMTGKVNSVSTLKVQ